ncbi:MAG: ligand-binding sensor domain-containing protein [Chitinophagales bacterium]
MLAQKVTYFHYKVEDGLPSNEIYSVIQDEKGYIWLATAMGVSRFDGKDFTTFNTSNGLSNNHVLDIKEDLIGRIWLLAADGQTGYIEGNRIIEEETNLFHNHQMKEGDLIIYYKRSLSLYRDSLEQDLFPHQKKYSTSCKYEETEQNIWAGTWGGGVYHYTNFKTDSLQTKRYLPQKTITSILKDREGNYWFATLDEGIFLLSNIHVKTYTIDDGLAFNDIHSVAKDSRGHLWLGSSKGTLSEIAVDGKVVNNYDISYSLNAYNRVNDILLKNNRKWLATDEGLLFFTDKEDLFVVNLVSTKELISTKQNRFIWAARYQDPIKFDTEEAAAVLTLPLQQVSSVCEDLAENIWIGNTQGLQYYADDSLYFLQDSLLQENISSLAINSENQLWVGTDGNGVLLLDISKPEQPQILLELKEKYGLNSDICHKIVIDTDDNAWICTNNGLNQVTFDLNSHNKPKLTIQKYTTLEGLPSNHIQDVLIENDTVWVASSSGLSFFDKNIRQKTTPPLIHIREVEVWYKDTLLQKRYDLDFNQNNIKISYDGLSFKSQGDMRYQYKMLGVDKEWIVTNQNVIQYPTLTPGAYIFRIYAVDKDNNRSIERAELQFLIAQHYTQQTWYKTLIAMLVLCLLTAVSYFLVKYFKERSDLKRRLVESEQMALRAQMNPHFIFNSLNSIQYFITENDKKSANLYLSIFSELMRKVLDNSKKPSILLEDEIEYISLYLNIESMRFKGKFEYEINIAPNIEAEDVFIPPMLIQPYIENALIHGLLQKKEGNCLLSIKFEQTEDILICTVSDNGIGRTKAAALQNRTLSKSKVGTTNPPKRLSILNKLNKRKIDVKIIDIYDKRNYAIGTRVKILIPILDI